MRGAKSQVPTGLVIISLLIVCVWGITEAKPFLTPISIAALLALTMAPLVRLMKRFRFPEWLAITISAIFLVLPFLTLATLVAWQGQSFIHDFPKIMETLNHAISSFVASDIGQRLHMTPDFNIEAIAQRLEGSASQGVQLLISGLGAVVGAGSQLALVLLFAVLMLASRKHLYRSTKRILKQSMHVEQPQLLEEVVDLFEQFLLARLLIVAIIGGADMIILFAFGIHYALLMGCFLGVMTLVPAVGFIIGVIPPIIVSFAIHHSFFQTLMMFVALFIMSIVEGNVLTPKMVGKKLNINALSTFVGLLAGGLLWGAWGMFLSIPILGVLRIIFNAVPSLQPWGDLLAEKDERSKKLLSVKQDSHYRDAAM